MWNIINVLSDGAGWSVSENAVVQMYAKIWGARLGLLIISEVFDISEVRRRINTNYICQRSNNEST